MVKYAITVLSRTRPALYIKYFGLTNTTIVRQVLHKVVNNKFDVNCGHPKCNKLFYAFVYPDIQRIFVCKDFFKAKNNEINSMAGILLHEATHFTSSGATDDHAYGPMACQRLAMHDPMKALTNADNYEYFVESLYLENAYAL